MTNNDNGLDTRQDFPMLTFRLAERLYALPVTDVVQVVEMVTLTPLPQAPPAIQGIINVRGRVVPVMDARLRFGLDPQAYHLRTPIILVDFKENLLGLIVDQVIEVLEIDRADLEKRNANWLASSSNGHDESSSIPHLFGVAKVDRRLIPILDLKSILNRQDRRHLEQLIGNFDLEGAQS